MAKSQAVSEAVVIMRKRRVSKLLVRDFRCYEVTVRGNETAYSVTKSCKPLQRR